MSNAGKASPLRTVLWVLIIIGFLVMEYPGVLFFNRIEPMIFGLPFIYSFNIIMWAIMCSLLLIGYLTNWGKGSDFRDAE